MPVNMDPNKRRRACQKPNPESHSESQVENSVQSKADTFGQETEEDREKEKAEAEATHLWDATEVINMDEF